MSNETVLTSDSGATLASKASLVGDGEFLFLTRGGDWTTDFTVNTGATVLPTGSGAAPILRDCIITLNDRSVLTQEDTANPPDLSAAGGTDGLQLRGNCGVRNEGTTGTRINYVCIKDYTGSANGIGQHGAAVNDCKVIGCWVTLNGVSAASDCISFRDGSGSGIEVGWCYLRDPGANGGDHFHSNNHSQVELHHSICDGRTHGKGSVLVHPYVSGTTGKSIHDCIIKGDNYQYAVSGFTDDFVIERCRFITTLRMNYSSEGGLRCYTGNNEMFNAVTNVTIRNCYFENWRYGIGLYVDGTGDPKIENFNFTNCTIVDSGEAGIEIRAPANWVSGSFTKGIFYNNADDVFLSNSQNFTISDNKTGTDPLINEGNNYISPVDSLAGYGVLEGPDFSNPPWTPVVTEDVHVIAEGGIFRPTERYGSLIVRNSTGRTLSADGTNMCITLDPVIDYATPRELLRSELEGAIEQMVFAAAAYSPAAGYDLREAAAPVAVLTLTNLANGEMRQSEKIDFGQKRAAAYSIRSVVSYTVPEGTDITGYIELWWAPSSSATNVNANAGNARGQDQGYTGYASNADDTLKQIVYLGRVYPTRVN